MNQSLAILPENHAKPGARETILLVDDEPEIVRLAAMALKVLRYQVLAAGSPAEALALARRNPGCIQVLLTDVNMPEMDGGELAAQVRLIEPDVKCVFMSGYANGTELQDRWPDAKIHFIAKPFMIAQLGDTIRAALDEPESLEHFEQRCSHKKAQKCFVRPADRCVAPIGVVDV